MKSFFTFVVLLLLTITFSNKVEAQVFIGDWYCAYATWDASTQPNATGYNTASVAVLGEDHFVALVRQRGTPGANYLVGYVNADSMNGRLGSYGFGGNMQGVYQQWISGFDLVELWNAYDVATGPDGKIYVANNDEERNILVFEFVQDDSVQIGTTANTSEPVYSYVLPAPYRMSTGTDPIWSITVDDNGYVYVTVEGDAETPGKVLVFEGPNMDDNWGILHNSTPITVIEMNEPGFVNGIAVKGDGTLLYTSNYTNRNVYCYIGSPTTGYERYDGFNFELPEIFVHPDGDTIRPGTLGMTYMDLNNVVFVASSRIFSTGSTYKYNRIHALNPNNGDELSYIDIAEWNYNQHALYSGGAGSYNSRVGGTAGTYSGYASTYNIDVDGANNVYAATFYAWTIDKWSFTGVIPIIPILIVSVEKNEELVPTEFALYQNYPNPFNPLTTIEFSVVEDGNVKLSVYSLTGELVADLVNTEMSKGSYKYTFDATKLASGTYIYTLTNGVNQISRKMTLLK